MTSIRGELGVLRFPECIRRSLPSCRGRARRPDRIVHPGEHRAEGTRMRWSRRPASCNSPRGPATGRFSAKPGRCAGAGSGPWSVRPELAGFGDGRHLVSWFCDAPVPLLSAAALFLGHHAQPCGHRSAGFELSRICRRRRHCGRCCGPVNASHARATLRLRVLADVAGDPPCKPRDLGIHCGTCAPSHASTRGSPGWQLVTAVLRAVDGCLRNRSIPRGMNIRRSTTKVESALRKLP